MPSTKRKERVLRKGRITNIAAGVDVIYGGFWATCGESRTIVITVHRDYGMFPLFFEVTSEVDDSGRHTGYHVDGGQSVLRLYGVSGETIELQLIDMKSDSLQITVAVQSFP